MTKSLFAGLLASLFLATALPVRAAEEPIKDPKPYIVLVGISDFADKQIKPRKHAEADAKALYDLFTSENYLGAKPENVRLLLGSKDAQRKSEAATKDNILKALLWVATEARRDDPVIIAFIGQGAPVGDRTCFFATDSTFKDRAKNALVAGDIELKLEKLKSQRFCALIDINLKGFDSGKESVAEPNSTDLVRVFIGNEDKEEHTLPPGRVIFLATTSTTQSLDLKDHGLFTQVMLTGLQGAADKDGYEPDGLITVDEMLEYVEKELPQIARENGKSKAEKEQFPLVWGGRLSHFSLTRNPKVTPTVEQRLAKLQTLVKENKLTAAQGEEGQALLARMPKLRSQQELRKSYQQLVDGKTSVDEFLKARTDIVAGTKMRESEALDYASKVMKAIKMVQEEYVKDLSEGELVSWAIRGLYRRLDEKRIPDDIKERLDKAKTMKEGELITLLKDVRVRLGKREDLDKNKDVDLSLQQMLAQLDPYTNYIDPEMLKRVEQDISGRFTGIGIQIRKDLSRDELLVVTPIKGSPAYKAGIKAGDIITTVIREVDSAGKKLDKPEILPTKGLALTDAVSKILGEPGTQVKLKVERDGNVLDFAIIRGSVEVESVLGVKRKTDDDWDYVIDPENRICYVRVTSFGRNTYRDLKRALSDVGDKGIKGFILDLRFNPGGLLDSAVRMSDLFIDDGAIVSIRPRVGKPLTYSGDHEGSLLDFPMVCLVNGGSASGSEIVSACLQDHRRAVIIGERSYGKGSVQNIQEFEPTGGKIKLTTASFWRPSGKNLNRSSTKGRDDDEWGVMPDKLIKLSRKDRDELAEHMRDIEIIPNRDAPGKPAKPNFKDQQLEDALDYLRGQIKMAARVPSKKAG